MVTLNNVLASGDDGFALAVGCRWVNDEQFIVRYQSLADTFGVAYNTIRSWLDGNRFVRVYNDGWKKSLPGEFDRWNLIQSSVDIPFIMGMNLDLLRTSDINPLEISLPERLFFQKYGLEEVEYSPIVRRLQEYPMLANTFHVLLSVSMRFWDQFFQNMTFTSMPPRTSDSGT
jgi:hypothetical protein